MSETQDNIATVVKEFFEDALVDKTPFDMGDIYDFVTSKVVNASIGDLDKVLKKLAEKGEIRWSLHDGTSLCVAEEPPQKQSTLFGAPSSPPSSTGRRKAFSKKQKTEALEALGRINPLPPALERLHDWLFEQVYGGTT